MEHCFDFQQIIPTNTLRNVWSTVRRIFLWSYKLRGLKGNRFQSIFWIPKKHRITLNRRIIQIIPQKHFITLEINRRIIHIRAINNSNLLTVSFSRKNNNKNNKLLTCSSPPCCLSLEPATLLYMYLLPCAWRHDKHKVSRNQHGWEFRLKLLLIVE